MDYAAFPPFGRQNDTLDPEGSALRAIRILFRWSVVSGLES